MLQQELSLAKAFNGHQETTFLSLSLSCFSSNSTFLLLTIASKNNVQRI